ncbi:putative coenzyme A biosynthesis bifunctional protein CoaBC (Includes: Phosphopantothenoylcysteine decarboxylase; Phosphopantothenate--cysteine ligase) [uncultured Desulfobacterium sp.]|uniref:Coenzyme A biosynthesis bifunctional protein CoaBC n=1 Tax=uncultured Desulfobacterium sp. TaxID=201089 RepID=A0A445N272_9BACT|nr:putative coenzyme A biosynthesis bifunctional protein CoaBC (Includes: Phosphopantothenoylcysteine decarboxylase; Phosphopantothenate--cysteine ligase) [uncultured Desulfobacterium sp.]
MKGKKIVVGVTGGIAAYKTAELVRLLTKADALVQVAMTSNACRFVTPMTFEALTGSRVIYDMMRQEGPDMEHITWGQEADLIIVAPATANFIAKMALGIGDDFLSTMLLAATAKVLVCPSMNTRMFLNPAVQNNIILLKERGITVMEPGKGELACRTTGPGRLPEPFEIVELAHSMLTLPDLSGLNILVTAGPTVEPIDPVRFISNRSSGKMGYAIAKAARRRGAAVTLVSGPTALTPPFGVNFHPVKTAEEMKQAVFDKYTGCDIIIKAAAVADYRPREFAGQKIKKGADTLSIDLVRNPDILSELGKLKRKSSCILVGFAAETEDLFLNARKKLQEKNLDMIVANDVSRSDAGFETDTNIVKMIFSDGSIEESQLMSKDEVADLILERSKSLFEMANS